ncbi:Nucleoporin NSP1 [Yarrowia lipolytica]|nr:Nucleoporin NSP1 [Yarrowia lipolytica]
MSSGFSFGANTGKTGGGFNLGNNASSGTTGSGSTGFSFGAGNNNNTTTNNTNTSGGTGGLFGGGAAAGGAAKPSLFSASGASGAGAGAGASSAPKFSFGATPSASTPAASSTAAPAASGGLFGGGAASSKPSFGGFGAAKTDDKPAAPAASTGGFSFGAKPADAAAAPKPSFGGFGATKTEDKPAAASTDSAAKPSFSFGGATKTEAPEPAATGGFSFGAKTEEKKDEAPKPAATGGFSFGGAKTEEKKDDTAKPALSFGGATAGAPAAGTTAAGTTGTAAPAAPAAGGLFGAKKDDKKEDGKTLPSLTAAPATSAASMASKTPVASAQPVSTSNLKNKSMEDIISKWTTELSTQSEEFRQQAQDIMEWDKVLVDNGDKISDIYAKVIQTEQTQTKVDQLLQYVGKQQDDLESLLTGYEEEASRLLGDLAGTDGLQPVDQERENAYNLAEDLGIKLESMGGNLSSVIEEVNKISNDINNFHRDDALTQIVKILNSHLSSLQWIDSNTQSLEQNIEAIKLLEKQVNSRMYGR